MRWNYTPVDAASVEGLSRQLETSRIVAELLVRNGIVEGETAEKFLQPTLATISDPFLLTHVEEAVERLLRAIHGKQNLVVLGDYDVDGVCSTTLMVGVLRCFGLKPHYVVPRRMDEGYGLTRTAIDRALERGKPDLFIALDCGTNSHEEVGHLRTLGVDVIVVDHHRSKDEPLVDAILINPHVHESENDQTWRQLCTVGLVFKVLHGLLKRLRSDNHPGAHEIKLKDYLDLVAMGTVADLVPLHGENRIFARHGLRVLAETRRPGVLELMRVAGIKPEQGINPVDISFRLGPRINASGRLADAAISVDLLLSEDKVFCQKAAQQLEELNRERQEIERTITERAELMVEEHYTDFRGIVLFDESWHPGVVGIVAGRISRKYHRPAIVLGNEGDLAKGSGRGVPGVNLVELLSECSSCLESWGGHPMAVGVSMQKTRVEEFRTRFDEVIRRTSGAATEPVLDLSGWLDGTEVHEQLMGELDQLHPFGQGNPEPLFGVKGVSLPRTPEVFKEVHFRFAAEDSQGRRINGVAWKHAHRLPPAGRLLDLVVQLNWNHYNGRKSLQLELHDWRLAEPKPGR